MLVRLVGAEGGRSLHACHTIASCKIVSRACRGAAAASAAEDIVQLNQAAGTASVVAAWGLAGCEKILLRTSGAAASDFRVKDVKRGCEGNAMLLREEQRDDTAAFVDSQEGLALKRGDDCAAPAVAVL